MKTWNAGAYGSVRRCMPPGLARTTARNMALRCVLLDTIEPLTVAKIASRLGWEERVATRFLRRSAWFELVEGGWQLTPGGRL